MRHFPWRECAYASVAIVLSLILYLGAYYSSVDRTYVSCGTFVKIAASVYPFANETLKKFFDPIHRLDCRLRPEYWQDVYNFTRSIRLFSSP
jgi:hypothetical protein